MNKLIYITIISFFLFGCPSDELGKETLNIFNKSDHPIYYWYSYDFKNYHYPYILPSEKPVNFHWIGINNGNGNEIGQYPRWGTVYSELPEGKFTVYFFDKLATTQEEWEDVKINHLVLRKDVTFEELKRNNYTIFYP
jgi:hypothetical protein